MLEIDGAQGSGSGTIVRYAMSLAALLGEELHLVNIRARRSKPGLQPQHLAAASACRELCRGELSPVRVGASELTFKPGGRPEGGHYQWDIGTAGSTTMLAFALLPLACFARGPVSLRITGGLFQDFAPSAFHMRQVLFPLLGRMGVRAELRIVRPGYVPRGGGIIKVTVVPVQDSLGPLSLPVQGRITQVKGVALSSRLRERQVSERMARVGQSALAARGYQAQIEIIYDDTALQAGAALALWAETDRGCLLGYDRAGAPGRPSEAIGRQVAQGLLEDLDSGATVDRYAADQLILFAALARGLGQYVIPRITEHVETNLWLVESILGARHTLEGRRLSLEGVGLRLP